MPAIHFCSIQLNITEDNCCQLIKLLNIPEKIPFCRPKLQGNISNNNLEIKNQNHTLVNDNSTFERATSLILNNISTTLFPITSSHPFLKYGGGAPAMPVMNLKIAPSEAPEEHLTFLFGIFMLISMAVICTLFLMKLAKVNSIQSSTSTIPPRLRFSPRNFARSLAAVDYSLMLCIPRSTSTNSNISNNSKVYNGRRSLNCQSLNHRQRRTQPPLVVLLGSSFKCDNLSNPESLKNLSRKGRSSVSIVSSSSMNTLLPQIKTSNSFTSDGRLALLNASTSNNNFSAELTPPPCYEELEELIENNKKE